jgi:hypothetical protein
MKTLLLRSLAFLTLVAFLFVTSCATVQPYTTPAAIQAEITALGVGVKPSLSPTAIKDLTIVREALSAAGAGSLDIAAFQAIIAKFPPNESTALEIALNVAAVGYALAYQQYGPSNPKTIAYVNAVANGLLAAGY